MARFFADGTIECLGRTDHQVKLRGFRIELGEIEAMLAQHPAVQQAVVVDREITGDRRLIGYVAAGASAPSSSELKVFLRARLPEYMIPAGFVFMEKLPLTPNGKVDRRALPQPEGTGAERENGFLAPRDAIELQLANAWENTLGVKPIGIKDNFFELGGHSLLAVRLFAQIEKVFGKKLPLATLFQAPDVENFAKLLRQEGWLPSWSSLVPIQPNGSRPPFFCVHAHGGNVLNFKDLARHLGPDQPFYGLQAQGLDGSRPRHGSVEEMAAHYLKEIREVQSVGPYLLGGHCFGAKVAFEMAQQLCAQGEEVALLALIDAFAPGYPIRLPWALRRVAQVRFHWGNLMSTRHKKKYVLEKSAIVGERAARFMKATVADFCLKVGLPFPAPHALHRTEPKIKPYNPLTYPGKITVFAPTESYSIAVRFEPHMGWDRLANGGLEVHEIPGKFAAIIAEPHVVKLAEDLRTCIERATQVALDGHRTLDQAILGSERPLTTASVKL
jgi:thioesterase domain-containing protein/acyl carrier protein